MLLGPNGQPISTYKKLDPPKLGPAYGDWSGRDSIWGQLPGNAILQFDLSRLTLEDFRQMRYHPQINASLMLLTFMLHQIEWHVEADNAKLRDLCEENLNEIWTRLIRAMSQSLWAGFNPSVLEWENDLPNRRIVIGKVKDLIPEECEVYWKTVEGYAPPTEPKPKFKVYDGIIQHRMGLNGYIARTEGNLDSINPSKRRIPPENTLWYPLLMEHGNYYGRKLLKSAFAPWYYSILMHLFANRYYERFGEPVPVGRYPEDSTVDIDGTETSGRQLMEVVLRGLRNRGVVLLPNDMSPVGNSGNQAEYDYQLEYLESQMRGADFERYMARLDEEISMSLFTPVLLMRTGDVGSHNLGVQHTQTWLWMLNALAGDMKEYIDRYLLYRLRDFNFGVNAGKVGWRPKRLGKENAETIRAIITEMIRQGIAEVNLVELGEGLGMDVKEIRQVTEPPTDPANPDDRQRTERDRSREKPRGTGEPRATGKEVSARIAAQVAKAWRDGTFGTDRFKPTLGYRRRFEHSLIAEGWKDAEAQSATTRLYGQVESVMEGMMSLGPNEYSGPKDFMAAFDRLLDIKIDEVCASG